MIFNMYNLMIPGSKVLIDDKLACQWAIFKTAKSGDVCTHHPTLLFEREVFYYLNSLKIN